MTILCLSGSRADYGYLKPVADALGVPVASLNTGAPYMNHSPVFVAERAAYALQWGAKLIDDKRPRMLVVVGDRWDVLSACQAAVLAGVPIAHIGAGEESRGSYDDRFRAAIEALASLHFCLTQRAYSRLMGKGILAGCTSVEPPAEIATITDEAILAVYPETAGENLVGIVPLARAALERRGLRVTVIGSNPDVGAADFRGSSLPLEDFHALLARAAIIVGNSSAGIIEAPILGTPSVNIGCRQEGRPFAASVFQAEGEAELYDAIDAAMQFGKRRVESPYYRPGAARIIADAIRNYLTETA